MAPTAEHLKEVKIKKLKKELKDTSCALMAECPMAALEQLACLLTHVGAPYLAAGNIGEGKDMTDPHVFQEFVDILAKTMADKVGRPETKAMAAAIVLKKVSEGKPKEGKFDA